VVVASRQLPVGAVLAHDDIEVRQLPADAVPSTAVSDPAEVVGRPVSAVITEREVLTAHDVRTGSVLQGQPEGTVAVWLPVSDAAVAEALSPGDRVDVHSPVDGRRVAQDVLVLAVRTAPSGSTGLIGSGGLAGGAGGAWLALSPQHSTQLAAARGADPAGAALLLALHPAPGGS
jgi:Flp pilus assembly protein CpaB